MNEPLKAELHSLFIFDIYPSASISLFIGASKHLTHDFFSF